VLRFYGSSSRCFSYDQTALFSRTFMELRRFPATRFSFECKATGSFTVVVAKSFKSSPISKRGIVERSTVFRIRTISFISSPRREMCSRSFASTSALNLGRKRIVLSGFCSGILKNHAYPIRQVPECGTAQMKSTRKGVCDVWSSGNRQSRGRQKKSGDCDIPRAFLSN